MNTNVIRWNMQDRKMWDWKLQDLEMTGHLRMDGSVKMHLMQAGCEFDTHRI